VGAWVRRWRETGHYQPKRQGQPKGSKLDAHEAFILALVEEDKDITLVEIGERLSQEHGITACPSTVWLFFERRAITYKKNGARRRAAARGRQGRTAGLVRRPGRSRSRQADLHRRDRRLDQDGAAERPGAAR